MIGCSEEDQWIRRTRMMMLTRRWRVRIIIIVVVGRTLAMTMRMRTKTRTMATRAVMSDGEVASGGRLW